MNKCVVKFAMTRNTVQIRSDHKGHPTTCISIPLGDFKGVSFSSIFGKFPIHIQKVYTVLMGEHVWSTGLGQSGPGETDQHTLEFAQHKQDV